MSLANAIVKVGKGGDLSAEEARAAFDAIFEGEASAEELSAFLLGLHKKGETVDEILGAAQSMRAKMIAIEAPPGTIDIVGTGGDNHGTLNVSTATAIVVASCGVPVAKHGNRASTSRSGSSDILAALGVNLELELKTLQKCLHQAKLCFLFAPRHHPAMRHVVEVRKKLGVRTIFNLLGPLTNPANVKLHSIGVYDLELLGPMAETLKTLGSERAWLAHGHDGMDEITTTSPTDVVEASRAGIRHFTLEPEQVGLPRVKMGDLKGGDAEFNAKALKRLLKGEKSAYRDIVLFNSAAALVITGAVHELQKGVDLAAASIDNSGAQKVLDKLVVITSREAA